VCVTFRTAWYISSKGFERMARTTKRSRAPTTLSRATAVLAVVCQAVIWTHTILAQNIPGNASPGSFWFLVFLASLTWVMESSFSSFSFAGDVLPSTYCLTNGSEFTFDPQGNCSMTYDPNTPWVLCELLSVSLFLIFFLLFFLFFFLFFLPFLRHH